MKSCASKLNSGGIRCEELIYGTPPGYKIHSKNVAFLWQHFHVSPLEQTTSLLPTQKKRDQRGFCRCLLQNIFIWWRKSSLCCQSLHLWYSLNASADYSMEVFTYLVTFGTRNTSRTLRICKRKKANELKLLFSCEFLVRSDIHSLSKGLGISLPTAK